MPPSRAHRKADMPIRSRTEFASQEEWTAYVRDFVPVVECEYVLACVLCPIFCTSEIVSVAQRVG